MSRRAIKLNEWREGIDLRRQAESWFSSRSSSVRGERELKFQEIKLISWFFEDDAYAPAVGFCS